jgi:hypothetical protein
VLRGSGSFRPKKKSDATIRCIYFQRYSCLLVCLSLIPYRNLVRGTTIERSQREYSASVHHVTSNSRPDKGGAGGCAIVRNGHNSTSMPLSFSSYGVLLLGAFRQSTSLIIALALVLSSAVRRSAISPWLSGLDRSSSHSSSSMFMTMHI